MTVSTTTNKTIYACDAATTEFDFTFKVFQSSDVVVTLYEIASGSETTLTEDVHYTVTGISGNGGTVTTTAVYSATHKLIVQRVLAYTQTLDYEENDAFPSDLHEEGLDRLVMLVQQLKEMIDRALLRDLSAESSLTFPALEDGYLYCDGSALSIVDDITTTSYAGTIARGADASKAASPSIGDLYFATDTKKSYVCYTAGTWTQLSILVGTDASKPASPNVGDVYFAYDTQIIYLCKTAASWVKPEVDGAQLSGLGSIGAGAGTIPVANLPTGFSANNLVKLSGNNLLPALNLVAGYSVNASNINSGTLPISRLRTYDSGYFQATGGTSHIKQHNFGLSDVTAMMVTVFAATDGDGTGARVVILSNDNNATSQGIVMRALGSTGFTLTIGSGGQGILDDNGTVDDSSYSYIRVRCLALE